MTTTLQELGALNLTYAIVLAISFIFAVISLVGAEASGALDFDADVATGFDFANVSPFALSMFGATFGLAGLLTRLVLNMTAIPSILWSGGLGLVIGGAAQALFIYVLSPSRSSHFSLSADAVNRSAVVTITVPAAGLGQIAFDNVSGRVTLAARSATGQPIKSGETVTIERVVGREAVVRPAAPV